MTDTSDRYTLVLADDDPDFHLLIADMLCRNGPFTIVGSAHDGNTAVEIALTHRPALVLMDVQMPHMNGLQATRLIRSGAPEVKVVMMSLLRGSQYEQLALEAGASALIPKSTISVASVLAQVCA